MPFLLDLTTGWLTEKKKLNTHLKYRIDFKILLTVFWSPDSTHDQR